MLFAIAATRATSGQVPSALDAAPTATSFVFFESSDSPTVPEKRNEKAQWQSASR